MGRPQRLAALTYSTYGPVLDSLDELRRRLHELSDAVDDLEGAISTDNPPADRIATALEAHGRIPELAMAVERAFAPARLETLMRRIARSRGVRADVFNRRSGERRFDP